MCIKVISQGNNAESDDKKATPVTWIGVLAAVPAFRNHFVMIRRDASPLQALFTL